MPKINCVVLVVTVLWMCVAEGICPAYFPAAHFYFPQTTDGKNESFDWLISLTNLSTDTPRGDPACPSAVYIGRYIPGTFSPSVCITSPPTISEMSSNCVYKYTQYDAPVRITRVFTLNVVCDWSATTLVPPSAFIVTANPLGVKYEMAGNFKSAAVCGTSPSPAPSPPPTTTTDVAFTVKNDLNSADTIRDAIAKAISVLVSTIAYVSDITDNSVRTVVYRFADSTAANAAITEAQDGGLASVGVTGASVVHPSDNKNDDPTTIIIAVVVPTVVVVAIIACVGFVLHKRATTQRSGDHQELMH